MGLCRGDVHELGRGIGQFGLGTNHANMVHERHALQCQPGLISTTVLDVPQSGAQTGTS